MSAAAPQPEEIVLRLDGKDVALKPTLGAARAVNTRYGGFTEAFERVMAFDLTGFTFLIAAGTGKTVETGGVDEGDFASLEAKVFATGLEPLQAPLRHFVAALNNGGRPPAKESARAKKE